MGTELFIEGLIVIVSVGFGYYLGNCSQRREDKENIMALLPKNVFKGKESIKVLEKKSVLPPDQQLLEDVEKQFKE